MNKLADAFASDATQRLDRWAGAWRESSWFESIDSLVHQHGANLVVVHIPMSSGYRQRVNQTEEWRSYSAWLAEDLTRRGDAYVDLSASVEDGHFGDGVHVDHEGAQVFSQALGRAIVARYPR
jgi:hypothetical protein